MAGERINILNETFSGSECAVIERLKEDFYNIYKGVGVVVRKIEGGGEVKPSDVPLYVFTRDRPEGGILLTDDNLKILQNHKVVYFIHGWVDNRKTQWYEDLKDAFLRRYPIYAVVQVDWSKMAMNLYAVAVVNAVEIGQILADHIQKVVSEHRIPLSDILIIGHSLGGQICGYIGKNIKKTGKKLKRIVALDPSGPIFDERPYTDRLNNGDAENVVVVHTDSDAFGLAKAIGTIDFFMNGGATQPGCQKLALHNVRNVGDPVVCDHLRAYEYFVEAILEPQSFKAKKCASWEDYKAKKCSQGPEVALGDLASSLPGSYFLETNAHSPFAKRDTTAAGFREHINKEVVIFLVLLLGIMCI